MLANYGYRDGEGEFYIAVDQDKCAECEGKPCLPACPAALFVPEEDAYGDVVVAIDDRKRNALKYECMPCKPGQQRPLLPCVQACPYAAINHSW